MPELYQEKEVNIDNIKSIWYGFSIDAGKSKLFLGFEFQRSGEIFEGLRVNKGLKYGRRIDPDLSYYIGYLNRNNKKTNGTIYKANGDVIEIDQED